MDVVPNLYRRLVLRSVFPVACPGCARPDPSGAVVCARCAEGLCPPAAVPPPPGIDRWVAAFAYHGVAREVVARVKYRNVRAALPWLGAEMCAALGAAGPIVVDVVTWAPTTPERRRARGFDPAELLARAVARRLRLPCRPLLRRLPGPPQTGLNAAARRLGPRIVARSARARPEARPAAVLVVDDVATTGATLAACAAALRASGALRVVALTAARTPPPARPR